MRPSDGLNFLQRAINRAGRPLGICPFPVAWVSTWEQQLDNRPIFERIAVDNLWGSGESISGPGSELRRTARYRAELLDFLAREQIESFFDAPCGDLNWITDVLAKRRMNYIGGDISASVIESARKRHPDLDLREFDICRDPFPDAQVWHCRDAFLHLSFSDIWAALDNAANSSVQFALLSTHRARILTNLDINTGGWRYLDLERAPFNFPRPLRYLDDSHTGEFPRAIGVWRIADVEAALAADRRGSR